MKTLPRLASGRRQILLAAFLFTTCLRVGAVEAIYYFAAKSMEYRQSNNAAPTPKGNPARFSAQIGLTAANSVTNATVQFMPAGTLNTLTLGGGGAAGISNAFGFQAKFASQSALDTAYPNGNYQIVIQALHDGTKTSTLALNGNAYPAGAPTISNAFDPSFGAVVVTNPASNFTLSWAPFSGGTTSDFIQVTIADSLGNLLLRTPDPGQPGALNGTNASLVIPANTLPTGSQIFAALVFAKVVQLNSTGYPGVPGYAAYYTETDFGFVTLAEDTANYNISKRELFNQTSFGAPVPAGGSPFRFVANVIATASNYVTSAQVQLPSPGGVDPLTPDPTETQFQFLQRFVTEAALDAAFVTGTYALEVSTAHDGYHVLPLTFPADAFPAAPHISNWAATQNVNAAADFNLIWDPFSGSSPLDFILVSATDSLGNVLVFELLPNTATSFDFPPNTFQSGQSYQVQVQFRNVTAQDTTTYPGATGTVQFISATTVNLTTAVTVAPALAVVTTNGLRPLELLLTGQTSRLYAIDAASTLHNASWVPLVTNTAVNGQFLFTDTESSNIPARFYRGRAAD